MGGALGGGAHLVEVFEGAAQGGLDAWHEVGEQEGGDALATVAKDVGHHALHALLHCLDDGWCLCRVLAATAHCQQALCKRLMQVARDECCNLTSILWQPRGVDALLGEQWLILLEAALHARPQPSRDDACQCWCAALNLGAPLVEDVLVDAIEKAGGDGHGGERWVDGGGAQGQGIGRCRTCCDVGNAAHGGGIGDVEVASEDNLHSTIAQHLG